MGLNSATGSNEGILNILFYGKKNQK